MIIVWVAVVVLVMIGWAIADKRRDAWKPILLTVGTIVGCLGVMFVGLLALMWVST